MNIKRVLSNSMTVAAILILASSVHARGRSTNTDDSNNMMSMANKQTKCFLSKMSVKGSTSFFGGNNKSIEVSCQDAGGENFEFSANGSFHSDLVEYAAQEVIIISGPNKKTNKVPNAKTDNIIISIKPVHDVVVDEQLICGPENPDSIEYEVKNSKIYSAGYRVARPVSFDMHKKEWNMVSYVGILDDDEWKANKKGISGVTFTRNCNMSVNKMLTVDTPLIFDYMQTKEEGKYRIGRVASLVIR